MNQRLAALDTLAACLTVGKTREQIDTLRLRLRSNQIDWRTVINLSNTNLLSPTLWAELCHHELQYNLPADVQSYLGEVHLLNSARNQRLLEQTLQAVLTLNEIGVKPVLLKGAISLLTKTYQDQGARMLTDIDILVPRERAVDCWNRLHKHGYSCLQHHDIIGPNNHKIWHHLEPISRSHDDAFVEIHHEVIPPHKSGRAFGASITIDEARQVTQLVHDSAHPVTAADLELCVPSPTARVLHCLLHSAFKESNAYRSGTLPLKSIHELALLQQLYPQQINWHAIEKIMSSGRKQGLLNAWIYLSHRTFGSTLPVEWNQTLAMKTHYLRCRLQARWGLSLTLRHWSRSI